jgi:16S rRNA (guanine1207-N2)-methyltransferase
VLTAPSELLLRNTELFEQGNWLLVNPTDTAVFNELSDYKVDGFYQYFDQYQNSLNLDGRHIFGAQLTLGESQDLYDGAIIYLPKAKPHLEMLLHNIACVVRKGGTVAVVGSNDAGIKSTGKLLKRHFEVAQKFDSARHCALWTCPNNTETKPFSLTEYESVGDYELNGTEWPIVSLPGVFSHGSLDQGTQLLLDSLPNLESNHILDFACGAGVIGCYIAAKNRDVQLSFSDINALALWACERSCELNNIKAEVIPSNGLGEWHNEKFDIIISNPPFHTGVATDYSITESFVKDAKNHLKPNGELLIVANRFLPYPELIDQHFERQADLAKSNKFSVYHAKHR